MRRLFLRTRPQPARPLTTLTSEQLAQVQGGGLKPSNPGYVENDQTLKPGDPAWSLRSAVGGFKPGGPG